MDRVTLRGLKARGHHGVFAHERRDGQIFVVDLVLGLDTAPAAAGDDLSRTVHYGVVAEAGHGRRLRRARRPHRDPRPAHRRHLPRARAWCRRCEVTVHKPDAPDHRALRRRDRDHQPEAPVSSLNPEYPSTPPCSPCPPPSWPRSTPPTAPCNNPRTAVIALGSNMGNRLETLQGAVDALEDTPGVRVQRRLAGLRDRAVGRRAAARSPTTSTRSCWSAPPCRPSRCWSAATRSRRRSCGCATSAGARAPSTWTSSRTRTSSPTTRC